MTASSTPCSRKPERRAFLALLGALALAPALAQVHGEVVPMQLERTPDGLLLSAGLRLDLPELVEDALRKGIPMYFVAEAEVLRERWYWSDKTVAQARRYLRLAFQPLTRRWRLNAASTPFTNAGLGMVLGQVFDDYDEAIATLERLSRWKIAEAADIAADTRYTVELRFRLDLSQLPRPFQISAAGQGLLVSRSQVLPPVP